MNVYIAVSISDISLETCQNNIRKHQGIFYNKNNYYYLSTHIRFSAVLLAMSPSLCATPHFLTK